MPGRCEPRSCASSFRSSICFSFAQGDGERVEKENSRGSKVGPRWPSLLNVPCCTGTELRVEWRHIWESSVLTNDLIPSQNGWRWLNETKLFPCFVLLLKPSKLQGVAACESKRIGLLRKAKASGGKFEEWIHSRSEYTSVLGTQKLWAISPSAPAVSNPKTFHIAELHGGEWWPAWGQVTEWQHWARETEEDEE